MGRACENGSRDVSRFSPCNLVFSLSSSPSLMHKQRRKPAAHRVPWKSGAGQRTLDERSDENQATHVHLRLAIHDAPISLFPLFRGLITWCCSRALSLRAKRLKGQLITGCALHDRSHPLMTKRLGCVFQGRTCVRTGSPSLSVCSVTPPSGFKSRREHRDDDEAAAAAPS